MSSEKVDTPHKSTGDLDPPPMPSSAPDLASMPSGALMPLPVTSDHFDSPLLMPDDHHGTALTFGTPIVVAHPPPPPALAHHAQINSTHPEYEHHTPPFPIGFQGTADSCPPTGYVHLYNAVRSHGCPNCYGASIPLDHQLNIPAWRRYLPIYQDCDLPDFLEFGFRLSYTLRHMPSPADSNHPSALHFPSHVDHYIETELANGALCGPFNAQPFTPQFQINPVMTTPKRNSDTRRVVLDLSFPPSAAVNTGIPKDTYLGAPYKLKLPCAQDLRDLILQQGPGCHLWSANLKRGYRQLRVCPADWPLLGISWRGAYYFDMAVPFGIRWGAMYMQRVTEAATNIASHEGIPCIAYIDDVASAQPPVEALSGKRRFQALLRELGLEENIPKGADPGTHITWLGVDFDTVAMTMSVPSEKIKDCLILSRKWATRFRCTKSQLRQYLGKLFHICQCCPTLRLFVNRMLETLRAAPDHGYQRLSPAFKADVHWILQYLPLYNGVQMIPYNPTLPTPIVVDSCLTGGGGHFGDHIYHVAYPDFVLSQGLNISELEILNALIAIKLWSPLLRNHVVRLLCDNSAAVSILQTGRGRASFMLSCARELWSYTAAYNFEIRVEHIAGAHNTLADQLSRYHSHAPCRAHIDNFLASGQFKLHTVDPYFFKLSESLCDYAWFLLCTAFVHYYSRKLTVIWFTLDHRFFS